METEKKMETRASLNGWRKREEKIRERRRFGGDEFDKTQIVTDTITPEEKEKQKRMIDKTAKANQ